MLSFDTHNEESLEYAAADDRARRWADLTDTYHPAISRNRRCPHYCAAPGERYAIQDYSAALRRRAVANGTSLPEEQHRTPTAPISS